ncbi:MAG: hypothetical protein HKM02_07900 [Pseudomonadales bacterium]|nr:hypothetical protein [Pseudomonadales bacterium]
MKFCPWRWMFCGLACYQGIAQAGLQSEMQSWIGAAGYGNYTSAGVYHNQYGGYWTGGSQSMAVPSRRIGQLFSYTSPHYSGGCTGIDSELGGFNFVNKDEIIQQLRAIGQNAKMLAYNLAIKYVSSLLADTMDWVKDKADFLNQLQMDSCSAAQNVLSAGFSAAGLPSYTQINDAEDREICIERQVINAGMTRDQAQASCGRGGARPGVLASDPEHFNQGNLSWYVLMQSPIFSEDTNLAEWVMNLTGTLILHRDASLGSDASTKTEYYPGMLYASCSSTRDCLSFDGKAILDAMIGTPIASAQTVQVWHCKDKLARPDACTQLTSSPVSVAISDLAKNNIAAVLTGELASIMSKLSQPQARLSDHEKALIEQSAAPLYRYVLASQTFFHSTQPDQQVQQYLRLLAQQLVARNIENIVATARFSFGAGKVNAAEDAKIKDYLDHLDKLGAAVASYEVDAQSQMQIQMTLLHNAQQYEQVLVGRISSNFIAASLFAR